MRIKNSDLLASVEFLSKINSDDQEISFAFKVSTIINRVDAAIKPLNDLRQKIVNESTIKDAEGKPVFLDPGHKYISLTEEGGKKLNELMELETTVECETFSVAELKEAGVKVKPAQLASLKWLIKA